MTMKSVRLASVAASATIAMVLAGCAAEPSSTSATEEGDTEAAATGDAGMEEMEGSFAFGEPADPSEADRTITVAALDDLAFDPSTVEVSAGEVITFEVENSGVLPHDFTLGDEEAQEEHAAEMAEMSGEEMGDEMAHDEPNALTLAAGETKSLTWRFTEPVEILYGCHETGHYEAGMVGSITVTS